MDPYSWIMEECQVSHHEDFRLRCCSYFGQSDSDDSDSDSNWQNPSDIPVAKTGIVMVSPPESSEEELRHGTVTLQEDQEIFHTPPETRSTSISFEDCNNDQIVGGSADGTGKTISADSPDSRRAIDLGRDTDLGFSEVEVDSTQRIEAGLCPNGASQMESEVNEVRVSKRGFSPKGQSSTEPPYKNLKSLDCELPTLHLGSSEGNTTEELGEWLDNWKYQIDNQSPGASSSLELIDQQNFQSNADVGEGSGSTQKLTEAIDSEDEKSNVECEKNNGKGSSREENAVNENVEGNSGRCKNSVEEEIVGKRVLPSWARNGATWRLGADKKVKVKERKPSRARNGADERAEANERKPLKASNGADERAEANEREPAGASNGADERVEVNEREPNKAATNSDNLSKGFEEFSLLNVLMALQKCDEDLSLECHSLLEVAESKWDAASSD